MRIIKLNEQSRANILADLLKRDPNNYSAYEGTVQEIVDDVRAVSYTHLTLPTTPYV